MIRPVLGLDIGGANLKAAHADGTARTRPFALWHAPERLAEELAGLIAAMPAHELLAVTMTAELCDCYETRPEGVQRVLDALEVAAGGTPILVWIDEQRFVAVAIARTMPLRAASGNWLALATFVGRYVPEGAALLVDVGSTTTDVVPIKDGVPVPAGLSDFERLTNQELIYSGVSRTPLCALLKARRIGGRWYRPTAEFFATTRDVYLLLDKLPEKPDDCNTADGRPATKKFAFARLARQYGAEVTELSWPEARILAGGVAADQALTLGEAILEVGQRLPTWSLKIISAGSGEFLVREAWGKQHRDPEVISLDEQLGPSLSEAACAYAVAVLAAERS